jgi:hypothetical protein
MKDFGAYFAYPMFHAVPASLLPRIHVCLASHVLHPLAPAAVHWRTNPRNKWRGN